MTIGQRATANANIAGSGSTIFTPSDFTTADGTALGATDAVIVRAIIHGNSIDLNRVGDPNGDGTFEINQLIQSRSGAGERHSETFILTDVAGLEISETSTTAQEVLLIGERVRKSNVFVEQVAGLGNASELARTTAVRNTEETIVEAVHSGSADIIRRHDINDDATFEMSSVVDSFSSNGVFLGTWLSMTDHNTTNAMMETALGNTSGTTNNYMLLGTIGNV